MSASERLVATAREARLHPVTWIVIWATVAHFVGDTIYAFATIQHLLAFGPSYGHGWPETTASIVHSYAYTTLFIASAATVEFLFRIWEELRRRRT